jgi:hypothetical protein
MYLFVRYESGEFVDGTPVILSTPIIGKEQRFDLNFLKLQSI